MTSLVEVRQGELPSCLVGGHSYSGNGVIMNLVCHVILQDHVIKGQVILWVGPPYGKSPLCHIYWP